MRSKRAWELSRLLGLSLAAAAGTAATGQAARQRERAKAFSMF